MGMPLHRSEMPHEAYKRTEKGPSHQRVIRQFRVRVEAIALKEETIGEGTAVAVSRRQFVATIPAKPAQACGYSPTTTGGPSKAGGHRIDVKPATGKQMFKVKPDPPELPKDAYTDDFPSLSKREAANRWRGGATRSSS